MYEVDSSVSSPFFFSLWAYIFQLKTMSRLLISLMHIREFFKNDLDREDGRLNGFLFYFIAGWLMSPRSRSWITKRNLVLHGYWNILLVKLTDPLFPAGRPVTPLMLHGGITSPKVRASIIPHPFKKIWRTWLSGMLAQPQFVQTFTTFQGKSSVLSPNCTSNDCVQAKVCYMRSGSASIALENCKPGFGSVQ